MNGVEAGRGTRHDEMTTRYRKRGDGLARGAFAAVISLAFLAAALGAGAAPLAAQMSALPGLAGGSLSEGDLAKGTTVIVVWASWSPRCRDIVPRVNELAGAVGGGARVVTVNFQEERAAVESFLAGKSLQAPVYLDASGDFSKAHAVTTLPGLIVYRNGEVRFQGRLEGDAAAQVDQILK
jgi:thiol-disulfide isomerase/thioredoxin